MRAGTPRLAAPHHPDAPQIGRARAPPSVRGVNETRLPRPADSASGPRAARNSVEEELAV